MTGIFGAILGLVTSLLPEGIAIFRRGQDHRYEIVGSAQ